MTNTLSHLNLDANSTIFFARELEHIKSRSYDVVYPALKATSLIPVSFEAGPGAETITYEQYDQMGLAKIISNYADDLPRSDIKGRQFTSYIRSIGASYGFNYQELRTAQFAGKSLDGRKALAVRKANDELVNRIAFYGDETSGLKGFINHPNVPVSAVENDGANGSTKWKDKTSEQILRDMHDLANSIVLLTKGMESPTTLLMPLEQFSLISTRRASDSSDLTILEYFKRNTAVIRDIQWVSELKGQGPNGTDMMIAYDKSPEKLTLEIPQPFEQLPVQERGLEYIIPCHSRIGGVIVYYPLSIAQAYGI